MADVKQEILLTVNVDTGDVDSKIKGIGDSINNIGGGETPKAFKNIKQELKAATEEAQKLGREFGLNSTQFTEAAKKVANLKDEFQDANSVIKNFNPDNKLQGLISVSSGAIRAVQGVAGAITFIGVNADTAQVAIAKLQGIMAFTEALGSLDEIKNSFNSLKNVATNALSRLTKGDILGLALVGITALGVAIFSLLNNTKKLSEEEQRLVREQENLNSVNKKAIETEGNRIATLTILYETIRKGGLTEREKSRAVDEYNTVLGNTIGKLNNYAAVEKNILDNGPEYIKYLKAKAKAEAAYSFVVEKEKEKLLLENRTDKSFNPSTFKMIVDNGILSPFFDSKNEIGRKNKAEELKNKENEINSFLGIQSGAQSEANSIADKLKIPIGTGTKQSISGIKNGINEVKDFIDKANRELELQRQSAIDKELLEIDFKYQDILKKTKQGSDEETKLLSLKENEKQIIRDKYRRQQLEDEIKKNDEFLKRQELFNKQVDDLISKYAQPKDEKDIFKLKEDEINKSFDSLIEKASGSQKKLLQVIKGVALGNNADERDKDSQTKDFNKSIQGLDETINDTNSPFKNRQQAIDIELVQLQKAFDDKIILEDDYNRKVKLLGQQRIDLQKEEVQQDNILRDSKLSIYNQIGSAIGSLGTLFKEGSAASRAAAVAEIAINTATGFIQGLDIAQKSAKGTGPAAAFAFPIFYATQIAAVLGAAAKAKQALSQSKVKGDDGPTLNAPTSLLPPQLNSINLNPQIQDVRVTNQGSQIIRAYISNDDLRTNEEKQQFLNKLSSF